MVAPLRLASIAAFLLLWEWAARVPISFAFPSPWSTLVGLAALPGSGPLNAADDLTVGPDGIVYVAYNGGGKVVRVDPATGESCALASGLPLVSSVRFGAGPGWDPDALYATSFTGKIYKLERS